MKTYLAPLASIALAAGLLPHAAFAQASCPLLNGPIKHVVFLEFDNVHIERDRAQVPSDLEQLPSLRNFLLQGTLSSNDHALLISHTANDILSSLTGVYSDRLGTGVSNSFGWYGTGSTTFRPNFTSDFTYWTDPVSMNAAGANSDTAPIMINEAGVNAPAPWTSYTKAGCDFGAVSLANMELENTTSDITMVFGPNSPESMESSTQKALDFEGIAIHCANVSDSICNNANGAPNAKADTLPAEPGGYANFKALYGHKYAVPAINNGSVSLLDTTGAPFTGFPGFGGMQPKYTLAYAAQMLEAGVPVVYGYIADAHDNHVGFGAFGPGETGYEQQLQNYDAAFATFFARLAADGINTSNTLFVVTTDEQDVFAGSKPAPDSCDGVTTPCNYVRTEPGQTIGEVNYDLGKAVAGATGNNTTFFDVHFDVAPNFYPFGNAPTPYGMTQSAQPGPLDPAVRGLEHTVSTLTYPDPYKPMTDQLMVALADQAEMKLLHMVSTDPQRTPAFTMFSYRNTYDSDSTSSTTQTPCTGAACVVLNASFAYIHGGIADRVSDTWVGLAGPGVLHKGQDAATWSDHADFRPTILALTGLSSAYVHDGRVLVEDLDPSVLPPSVAANQASFVALAAAYKQLNAPFGKVSEASLQYATPNVASTDDAVYQAYLTQLGSYTTQRDSLAGQIKTFLDNVSFHGQVFDPATAGSLTRQANTLIKTMVGYAHP